MPIYTYECQQCGVDVERVVAYEDRDSNLLQHVCGGTLKRLEQLEKPTIGKPEYQMKAILPSGAKVKGHFGKEAKRTRMK